MASQTKGVQMGRVSKRSGWLQTLRSCMSTPIMDRKLPLASCSRVLRRPM